MCWGEWGGKENRYLKERDKETDRQRQKQREKLKVELLNVRECISMIDLLSRL